VDILCGAVGTGHHDALLPFQLFNHLLRTRIFLTFPSSIPPWRLDPNGTRYLQVPTNIYRWWCKTLLSTAAVARIWPYNCTICSQRSHNAIKPGGSIHFHFLFHPIFHIFSPFSPYCFIAGYLRVKVVRDFFEQLQSPRQSQCALPRDCWLHRGGTVSMSMAALAVLNGIVSCIPTLRWSP
jgi:hypothetical protein